MDRANITIEGTVTSTAEAQGPDLFLTMRVEVQAGVPLTYRVLAAGDTLEGFSPGDRQRFTGRLLRVNSSGQLVVRLPA